MSRRWVVAGAAIALLLGYGGARLSATRPYESAFSVKLLPTFDAHRIIPQIFHLLQQPEMLGDRMILTRRTDEREFEVRVLCPKQSDAAENAKWLQRDVAGAELEPDRVVRMVRMDGTCVSPFTSLFLREAISDAEAAFRKSPGPATHERLLEIKKIAAENELMWRRLRHLEVTRQATEPRRISLGQWAAIQARGVVGW